MSKVVVDSSAVIAYLRREPGWEALEGYLAGICLISAVNLTEVVGTLRDKGIAAGAGRGAEADGRDHGCDPGTGGRGGHRQGGSLITIQKNREPKLPEPRSASRVWRGNG